MSTEAYPLATALPPYVQPDTLVLIVYTAACVAIAYFLIRDWNRDWHGRDE